ncbi:unnamed protein product [marine sediment metagenome]|uniref:Serine aminopeptidase S33 domain-containing protein n=1 Tax=marine sediment metagenome TaxID=412755 RepID=X1CEV0_9ZZZZ
MGVVQKGCPRREFMEFVRFATDVPLDAYLRCTAGLVDHDASDVFAEIQEPVLMLAADNDVFVNAEECRTFAARLPHGRFELLHSGSHAVTLEYGTDVAQRIRRFVRTPDVAVGCAA